MRRIAPFLFSLALWSSSSAAQSGETRRIVGRVIDANTGAGISDAGVQVGGTTLGAQSCLDGRYAISTVPAGTITLTIRTLGYTPKTVTGLFLEPNEALDQVLSIRAVTVQLEVQVTTASPERGNVSDALDSQRTSARVVNFVTAEQIAKSPIISSRSKLGTTCSTCQKAGRDACRISVATTRCS